MKRLKLRYTIKELVKKNKGYKEFDTINELLVYLKLKEVSANDEKILYDKLCRYNYVDMGSWRVHGIMY